MSPAAAARAVSDRPPPLPLNPSKKNSYIQCDLGALFADAGFVPGTKYVASASKTLSFTKPL